MRPLSPEHAWAAKKRAASVSLAYNLAFTILKLVAAVMTGSVSLLSEGVHSATDVVSSTIALVSVRAAALPPDDEHPYGHGKIESLAGFGESILLILIVLYIFFESIQRFIRPASIERLDFGIWVMVASTITSLLVARYVGGVAKQTDSMALRANGQHLMIDFVTSLAVLVALGVTRVTGWAYVDAIFAILFALWLGFGAWTLSREAFHQLIDRKIAPEEIAQIEIVLQAEPEVLSYHRLRTRHSGNEHFVDLHVVVPNDWSVVQAHALADRLEKEIEARLTPAHVVIHVDPYDPQKDIDPTGR